MKITKLYNGNYQRNGICGEGFFSVFMEYKENKKIHKNFLITFDTSENNVVDITNCRAVCIDEPKESWRGDVFADELNRYFSKNGIKDVYEYIKGL